MPRTEISLRSWVGVLTASTLAGAREPPGVLLLCASIYPGSRSYAPRGRCVYSRHRVLHCLNLQIPLNVRPLRGQRGPGSHEQAEEQQFLHDLTSLVISSTSDSTSLTASSTATRTGSLSSISMSS